MDHLQHLSSNFQQVWSKGRLYSIWVCCVMCTVARIRDIKGICRNCHRLFIQLECLKGIRLILPCLSFQQHRDDTFCRLGSKPPSVINAYCLRTCWRVFTRGFTWVELVHLITFNFRLKKNGYSNGHYSVEIT